MRNFPLNFQACHESPFPRTPLSFWGLERHPPPPRKPFPPTQGCTREGLRSTVDGVPGRSEVVPTIAQGRQRVKAEEEAVQRMVVRV